MDGKPQAKAPTYGWKNPRWRFRLGYCILNGSDFCMANLPYFHPRKNLPLRVGPIQRALQGILDNDHRSSHAYVAQWLSLHQK